MPTNTRQASPRARHRSARGWIAEPGEASFRSTIGNAVHRGLVRAHGLSHDGEQAIAHAVGAHLLYVVSTTVAAGEPEALARAAPQPRRALLERRLRTLLCHVLDHQDVLCRSVLKDHG